MLVNEIANKIRSLNLDGMPLDSAGSQIIRVATLEADLPRGILVKTPIDGLMSNPEMPGYLKGTIQVIVRGTDPEADDALARSIMAGLRVIGEPLSLVNYRLNCFYPLNEEPIMYPINDGGLFEHSINFECVAVRL